MIVFRNVFAIIVLFITLHSLYAQRNPEITIPELQKHLKYLASDKLQGREAGTKGAEEAARYLANEFKLYGLKPLGDKGTYLQNFNFISTPKPGKANVLSLVINGKTRQGKMDKDFRPFNFSANNSFQSQVMFVGYGISAPSLGYDDYAGLDVKDKILIMLRNSPPSDSIKNFGQFSRDRYKASKAKELGAKALLLVQGIEDYKTDNLVSLRYDISSGGSAGIVVIHIKRSLADEILASVKQTINDLQKKINETKSPSSFALTDVVVRGSVDLKEMSVTTANVVGMLEGTDPSLKDQVIVIGAHYDHLGMGLEGSSMKPEMKAVHNGADDNGSGTTGLLELAQAFAAKRLELKRSMIFVAFTGEELGVLGSAHYVKTPPYPLEKTAVMMNMDMIGRLNNRKLIVYGTGTSPDFEKLAKKYNRDSTFDLKLVKDGFGPSDQASFYGKNIPVYHFFTDLHSDYHTPFDDYEKINFDGMKKVVKYVYEIAHDLDIVPERPKYLAVETPKAPAGRGVSVSTGVIPDFGGEGDGFKISGVRAGSTMANAGLTGGDIIIKFGKVDIKNIYDYTYALGEYKPGDEVEVTYKRGTEVKTIKVKLEKRSN
ncbi:MAG: M28 family peptidase [bacterium]